MLTTAKTLTGYALDSLDGEIGKAQEFYFDDHYWTIRYLVADTGNWLSERKVLISPYALETVDQAEQHIAIDLSKEQIEHSPSLGNDMHVSHQFEEDYHGYYGWPMYWDGPYAWGQTSHHRREHDQWSEYIPEGQAWDPQLRSTQQVSGYHLQASDGEIGHVVDFIIDDETWTIRYLIISTRNWWPGNKVLIAPQWINRASHRESKVFVNFTRETIKQSPKYTEESLLSLDYETELYRNYDLPYEQLERSS